MIPKTQFKNIFYFEKFITKLFILLGSINSVIITGEIQKETFTSYYTFFVFIIEKMRMNYLITFYYYINIFVSHHQKMSELC